MEKHLLIRADANTAIGTGHVMRCLALAQAWREKGGRSTFVMAPGAEVLELRLRRERMEVMALENQSGSLEDAAETLKAANKIEAGFVVLDGYHFGVDFQRKIKDSGLRQLFVDDYGHAEHYCADLVLNQNISADEQLYASRESDTRLLLGTRFAMLRREFRDARRERETTQTARKILVTLGGGDPENVTCKVIQALQRLDDSALEARIAAGAANPHHELLRREIRKSANFQLLTSVTNMPDLMAWADVAISAGGSTCWELAFMGVPSLAIILADNQRLIAERLGQEKVAINLGWHKQISTGNLAMQITQLLNDRSVREVMSQRGRALVDGHGSARVAMQLSGTKIRLQPASQADSKLLWEWANDPEVRASSFSTEPIPWEVHCEWFERKQSDPRSFQWIALRDDDTPAGQVRFDLKTDDEAEIGVSVAPELRGEGYGAELIGLGVAWFFRITGARVVHAWIKPENAASCRAFEQAGFGKIGNGIVHGHPAVHYAREIR